MGRRKTILVVTCNAALTLAVQDGALGDAVVAHDRSQVRSLLETVVFDVVVVDAELPDRQCAGLLFEFAARWPGIRRVVVGGGGAGGVDRLLRGGLSDDVVHRPAKPRPRALGRPAPVLRHSA